METLALTTLCLVDALSSPTYRERETAHTFLKACGAHAIPALTIGEKSPNPECSTRCTSLLDHWYSHNAERLAWALVPKDWEHFPWVDSLCWANDPDNSDAYSDLRGGYLTWATEWMESRGLYAYEQYTRFSVATQRWMEDLIRTRQLVKAQEIMSRLAEGHRNWCKRNGQTVPP